MRLGPLTLCLLTVVEVGHAQEDGSCVVLTDRFSAGEAVADILEVELGVLGVTLGQEPAAATCTPVQLNAVSPEVAVVEVGGDRSRVVDLSSVETRLRPRSLALAIAEELHALHVDAPQVQDPPDPHRAVPAEVPDVPDVASVNRPQHAVPADPSNSHRLVFGAHVTHAFGSSQSLIGGRAGVEVDVGVPWARPRIGLEGSYGSKDAAPFGDLQTVAFGGWLACRFTLFGGSDFGLAIDPEIASGVAWLRGSPEMAASVNVDETARYYLSARVAFMALWYLGSTLAVGLGPEAGVFIVGADVLGDGEVIGGLSGATLGVRLEVSALLP